MTDVTVTTTAKALGVAAGPLNGLVLSEIKVTTVAIGGVNHIRIDGTAVRPAQKNDTSAVPITQGIGLLLDLTTAAALVVGLGTELGG